MAKRTSDRSSTASLLRLLLTAASVALLLAAPGNSLRAQPTADAEGTTEKDPALQQIDAFIESAKIDKTKADWKTGLKAPPLAKFDLKTHRYYWQLATTVGPIRIRLMPEVAPQHVTSTIYLTRLGFYDKTLFHRILPGYIVQGGCPKGDGLGDPGYHYDGEYSKQVGHSRAGVVSIANEMKPNTDGSQFFITLGRASELDGKFTVFGEVVEGLENLRKLGALGTDTGKPKKPVALERATIEVMPYTADAAMEAIDKFIAEKNIDTQKRNWKTSLPRPPQAKFTSTVDYFWILETNKGKVHIKLMPDVAPMHVSSTIYLTKLGFYDGLKFHRVITGFMAQGGCPLGTGTGGPGYKYQGEYSANVVHDRGGLLSMANAGPGTDGSQFFLTFKATPWLNNKHTIFGEVVEGMDTVQKLEQAGSPRGTPKEPLSITKAKIVTKPKAE